MAAVLAAHWQGAAAEAAVAETEALAGHLARLLRVHEDDQVFSVALLRVDGRSQVISMHVTSSIPLGIPARPHLLLFLGAPTSVVLEGSPQNRRPASIAPGKADHEASLRTIRAVHDVVDPRSGIKFILIRVDSHGKPPELLRQLASQGGLPCRSSKTHERINIAPAERPGEFICRGNKSWPRLPTRDPDLAAVRQVRFPQTQVPPCASDRHEEQRKYCHRNPEDPLLLGRSHLFHPIRRIPRV